jgi:hypothetical protein
VIELPVGSYVPIFRDPVILKAGLLPEAVNSKNSEIASQDTLNSGTATASRVRNSHPRSYLLDNLSVIREEGSAIAGAPRDHFRQVDLSRLIVHDVAKLQVSRVIRPDIGSHARSLKLRAEHAQSLLHGNGLDLEAIAAEVG